MMCGICKRAGFMRRTDTLLADELHALCEYPQSCTCGHSVSAHNVNWVLVEQERQRKIEEMDFW